MELLEYWFLFLRRKYLILGVFILSLVIGAGYLMTAKPVYEADCTVLVADINNQNYIGDMVMGAAMMESIGKADPINTQLELIKRRPIIARVVKELRLKGAIIDPEDLMQAIAVQSVRNTNLITMKYKNTDKIFVAEVVNTLAKVFVNQNQQFNQEEITTARAFIEKQLELQKQKVAAAENAVTEYKRKTQTVVLAEETTIQLESVSKMEATRMELDSKIQGSIAQQKELEAKIDDKNSQSNPFYSFWMKSLEEINNELTNLKAQLQSVTLQIATINSGFNKLPPKEVELARLMRDEKLAGEIYVRLQGKYDEVRINEASKVANIKIVEPAVIQTIPIAPNKKKIIMLSALLGLMLGFGLALGVEYLDDKPRSLEEVKKVLPYPVLGQIPFQKGVKSLFVVEDSRSPITESIRLIYSNLKFTEVMNKSNVSLMITSALADEGKSTIISNFALAMVRMNKKIILVDVDFRRSRIGKIFKNAKSIGVTDYLIGDVALSDIIYTESDLDIISAGTLPPNPAELLYSKKMLDLITNLKKTYDVVLFDMPPITMVSETLIFSKNVDGMLLVVDMMNTSMRAINAMQNLLHEKELPVLGVIYNKLARENLGYAYYSYKEAYS